MSVLLGEVKQCTGRHSGGGSDGDSGGGPAAAWERRREERQRMGEGDRIKGFREV